jgi:hypothetical protein
MQERTISSTREVQVCPTSVQGGGIVGWFVGVGDGVRLGSMGVGDRVILGGMGVGDEVTLGINFSVTMTSDVRVSTGSSATSATVIVGVVGGELSPGQRTMTMKVRITNPPVQGSHFFILDGLCEIKH